MSHGAAVPGKTPEKALANDLFDHFCCATTMMQILALHREMCNTLKLLPTKIPDFYPKLKEMLSSWKAQALFKKFDIRYNHKVYLKGKACPQTKVLIIGAGPCGLRAAIEAQLLGAKVVVIEKRDRFSRNNVLHLWPFVIHDLRALGAKHFYGKFCAGTINHICIRKLQCILLKVSLLLGVEFYEGVSFEELLEPTKSKNGDVLGWHARVLPVNHPVSQYEFDVLIGADGKRNTLKGFERREFRGKLAIAITANFINFQTEQEASVQEISGVAFIFNQKFFKDLFNLLGIDLENIVYYKDDTHYFVMTAKKASLIEKGVIIKDYADTNRLLSRENVDRAALLRYAREAAEFSTDGLLPNMQFALNHKGEPDVALFDFTSMYAAENASMVMERLGFRLLCALAGDSLLEPFWPTGSGCARGFLSAIDAAWMIRTWGQIPQLHPLSIIAERESIYRLLGQTTPENLSRDYGGYSLDPGSRYPNLNRTLVSEARVMGFYNSDDPQPFDTSSVRKRKREVAVSEEALMAWVGSPLSEGLNGGAAASALAELVRRYRPDLLPPGTPDRTIYRVLNQDLGIPIVGSPGVSQNRNILAKIYQIFKGDIPHLPHASEGWKQVIHSAMKEKASSLKRSPPQDQTPGYSGGQDEKRSESGRRSRKKRSKNQVSNSPLPLEVLRGPAPNSFSKATLKDFEDKLFSKGNSEFKKPETATVSTSVRDIVIQINGNVASQVRNQRANQKPTKSLSLDLGLLHQPTGKTPERRFSLPCPITGTLAEPVSVEDEHFVEPKRGAGLSNEIQRKITRLNKRVASQVHVQPVLQKPLKRTSKDRRMIRDEEGSEDLREALVDQLFKNLGLKDNMSKTTYSLETPTRMQHNGKTRKHTAKNSVVRKLFSSPQRHSTLSDKRRSHRQAARNITESRFQNSVRLLALGPVMTPVASSAADLENDVGLLQYRQNALPFNERVQHLEKQISQQTEGRSVGSKARGCGSTVARLAAELLEGGRRVEQPRSSKPEDLLRAVGKIENDDWQVKEIERKILENRLGRPQPGTAARVPSWNREQFLARQSRMEGGDTGETEERYGQLDQTLRHINQKLQDSGRPDLGTKKVANLADKFVKKQVEEPEKPILSTLAKPWSGSVGGGVQCMVCEQCVFAAEGINTDGLKVHKACFRCAICHSPLRNGCYTTERNGKRLFCPKHGSAAGVERVDAPTPERIGLEASDDAAPEMDEDEWTSRNFLTSETSGAGLSGDKDSSSEEYSDAEDWAPDTAAFPAPAVGLAEPLLNNLRHYISDDSFGYDDYSDDGAESSGAESCSRMRAAREARRREVPAPARPATDSSEVESEEESVSSESEVSSGTEVSTDSEFAQEEVAPPPSPPAITVTEPPAPPPVVRPPPPPPHLSDYPLSRARSAGGLATKRALELKRKYLLGEPSPPTVRRSDSASRLDTQFETFRSNITEFQKLLHPATTVQQTATFAQPILVPQVTESSKPVPAPMPDIIKNLCEAPLDLLAEGDKQEWPVPQAPVVTERSDKEESAEPELESDSLLSEDDSSVTEAAVTKPVPRLEVHDASGELIQLDSLMVIETNEKDADAEKVPANRLSESSESSPDVTTLALTETELSDWAAESAVLDECGLDERGNSDHHLRRTSTRNPCTLGGLKNIHEATNIETVSQHVCGRSGESDHVVYSNALEHFEFADEGEPDVSIEMVSTPRNEGYMEFVEDFEDDLRSPMNDRSMDFIERRPSETIMDSSSLLDRDFLESKIPESVSLMDDGNTIKEEDLNFKVITEDSLMTDQSSLKTSSILIVKSEPSVTLENLTLDPVLPLDCGDISPPLAAETPVANLVQFPSILAPISFSTAVTFTVGAPSICRSSSETFARPRVLSTSDSCGVDSTHNLQVGSGPVSPASPVSMAAPTLEAVHKVEELKREREKQTEVVRRLVLERLGAGGAGGSAAVARKSSRRARVSPSAHAPSALPPIPPAPPSDEPPPVPPPPAPARVVRRTAPSQLAPSFSDPELARVRRRRGIIRTVSDFFSRRLSPRAKESSMSSGRMESCTRSTARLSSEPGEELPPLVPPPPQRYHPDLHSQLHPRIHGLEQNAHIGGEERQWSESDVRTEPRRYAPVRLADATRAPLPAAPDPAARRIAQLQRRLRRPLSAGEEAATVAELVQVAARSGAHAAMHAADRRRGLPGTGD